MINETEKAFFLLKFTQQTFKSLVYKENIGYVSLFLGKSYSIEI